jgi:hypothetical protein
MPMRHFLITRALLDLLFLVTGFLLLSWIFPGTVRVILPRLYGPFLIMAGLWIGFSYIGGKYRYANEKSLRQFIWGILIADITMLVILMIVLSLAHVNKKIIFISLGTGAFAFMLECLWVIILYSRKRFVPESFASGLFHAVFYPDPEELADDVKLEIKPLQEMGLAADPAWDLLPRRQLAGHPELAGFIGRTISGELPYLERRRSLVVDTCSSKALMLLDPGSQHMIINLHKMNDIRRVNRFLILINQALEPGGYLVGHLMTLEKRKELFLKSHWYPFNWLLYTLDFLFTRVMPKLPVFKEIYFFITRGENRIISTAEIFGRLSFCGFTYVGHTEIGDYLNFIVRKERLPRQDPSPSYYPFISMHRVGEGGRMIRLYKLRTMHPYSEYLQEALYKYANLDESGKLTNDFRVTTWGRFMRKFWIDELPQFLNYFRGQVKLVGVRPLTKHFFSLYPEDMQQLRIRVKPGIIPPFYHDMPKSLEEVVESERRFIEAYFKHPFKTNWKYFWRAIYNIVIKGARSK